jgi:hypothetical protein
MMNWMLCCAPERDVFCVDEDCFNFFHQTVACRRKIVEKVRFWFRLVFYLGFVFDSSRNMMFSCFHLFTMCRDDAMLK